MYRSTSGLPYVLFYNGSGIVFNATDATVLPTIQYRYILETVTGGGRTNSTATIVIMPPATLMSVPAPRTVIAQSAWSIYVGWDTFSGVDQFEAVLNAETPTEQNGPMGASTSYTFTNLTPFTVYLVRLKACLQNVTNGCSMSQSVSVMTLETTPQGQDAPTLYAISSHSINISWSVPSNPFGIIISYLIDRQGELQPSASTSSNMTVTLVNVTGTVQSYVDSSAGIMPYTEYGYRVTAANSKGEIASNWSWVRTLAALPQVLATPVISNIGAFSFFLKWQPPLAKNGPILYYKVNYGVISSVSTTGVTTQTSGITTAVPTHTDTVLVDGTTLNTSISGLLPYTLYSVRITATNPAGGITSRWTSTMTQQAAPSRLGQLAVEQVTTGTSVILTWNVPQVPNGIVINYLIYEEGSVNAIYQGLTRQFEYLRLQPFTQYTVRLEACTIVGCTRTQWQSFYTAEIVPANQPAPTVAASTATYVMLHWTPPLNPYGIITSYSVLRRSSGSGTRKRSVSNPVVVYTTPNTNQSIYRFTDFTIQPYHQYDYLIRVNNSKGHTDSLWQTVLTQQAPPAFVSQPVVTVVTGHYDQLLVQWTDPIQSNGVIQSYQLLRNNSMPPWSFGATDPKNFTDRGLLAYTVYSYIVTICTGGGCTTSAPTYAKTPEGAPPSVAPPVITAINSTSLSIMWPSPQITNGQISEYHLKMDNAVIYIGPTNSYVAVNLTPYQMYTFVVTACTTGGCTDSAAVTSRPYASAPTGMHAPTIQVTSSLSVELSWQPPDQPNGIITSYELRRNGTLILTSVQTGYVDYGVQPGTLYAYRVTAFNAVGSVQGPSAFAITFTSSPFGLNPPNLVALSSTSIGATWTLPVEPNGNIVNYTLYQSDVMVSSNLLLSTIITGLTPWTNYSFRIQACTAVGCAISNPAVVQTLEALPVNLSAPILTALVDSHHANAGIEVQWSAPIQPNGVIIQYNVYRRNYTGFTTGIY